MSTFNVTNRVAHKSFGGQSILVTINQSDVSAHMANITVGQKATIGSTSNIGYVKWVDNKGYQILITPQHPFSNLASSTTPAIVSVGEVITFG